MGKPERSRAADHGVRSLSSPAPTTPSPARRVAQAVDALRHGWPIALDGGPVLLPIETGIAASATTPQLLISAARAATLKLANQREAAVPHAPVLIHGGESFTLRSALAVADPALDLDNPLKGPFRAEPIAWQAQAEAALELARIAGILPAFMVDPAQAGEPVPVPASDLAAWQDRASLRIVTRACLPVSASEDAEIVAFRSADDLREHVALVIGQQRGDVAPLVRLHSECLTGDVFGSFPCDCGPQLHAALRRVAEEGRGVVLELPRGCLYTFSGLSRYHLRHGVPCPPQGPWQRWTATLTG